MNIQERIQQACENNDCTMRSYSGRFMYGRNCLGIVGEMRNCMKVIEEVISEMADEVFDACMDSDSEEEYRNASNLRNEFQVTIGQLLNYTWDSMGQDVVIYWERIDYVQLEEPEDEDEE